MCQMISLLVVCPFLKNDVLNLASYFVAYRYLEDNGVFYTTLEDNEGKTYSVTDEIVASWFQNWASMNVEFEHLLQSDDDL